MIFAYVVGMLIICGGGLAISKRIDAGNPPETSETENRF